MIGKGKIIVWVFNYHCLAACLKSQLFERALANLSLRWTFDYAKCALDPDIVFQEISDAMHEFNTIVYLDFVLSLFWAAENRIIVQDSLSAGFFWKLELFKTRDTFMFAFFIYSQSDE